MQDQPTNAAKRCDRGSQVRIRLSGGAKWIRTLGPTLGIIVSRSLLSSRPVPLWESGNHHFANGEPKVRIHLPPPASQLRTWLPRSGCLTVLVPADRADDALRSRARRARARRAA